MNPLTKKCHVCGDRATGFNYNGLSCESCKVFFHRNSSRLRELYCERAGKCAINVLSRKDCSRCRLDKCFLIGMRRFSNVPKCDQSSTTAEQAIQYGIEQFLGISTLKRITKTDMTQLAEYVSNFPKNRSIVKLSSYEQERISEVQTANCVFPNEANYQMVSMMRTKAQLYEYGQHWDLYVRKSINFCQNFSVFNNLTQEDQMTLLKSFIFDILKIRFSFILNFNEKFMPVILNEEGTKAVGFHEDIYKEHKNQDVLVSSQKLAYALQKEMEDDIVIRDLLVAICLFQSHQQVSCPEIVRYHYFLYTQLLVRYLERKYRNKKAIKRKYHKLMDLLAEMQRFKSFKHKLMEEFDVSKFPSIIRELYFN